MIILYDEVLTLNLGSLEHFIYIFLYTQSGGAFSREELSLFLLIPIITEFGFLIFGMSWQEFEV